MLFLVPLCLVSSWMPQRQEELTYVPACPLESFSRKRRYRLRRDISPRARRKTRLPSKRFSSMIAPASSEARMDCAKERGAWLGSCSAAKAGHNAIFIPHDFTGALERENTNLGQTLQVGISPQKQGLRLRPILHQTSNSVHQDTSCYPVSPSSAPRIRSRTYLPTQSCGPD